MKIISGENRLFNAQLRIVYIFLSGEDYDTYAVPVKALNRYTCFTRRLYHFKPVLFADALPLVADANILDRVDIRKWNMFTRVVNDAAGNHYYAFESINLKADGESVEMTLQKFVTKVSQHNMLHLKDLIAANTAQHKPALTDLFQKMMNAFEASLNRKYRHARGAWGERDVVVTANECVATEVSGPIYGRSLPGLSMFGDAALEQGLPTHIPRPIKKEVQEFIDSAKLTDSQTKALWQMMEKCFDTSTTNTIKQTKGNYAPLDTPARKPHLKASIKRVVCNTRKDGSEKKEYVVELCVNDNPYIVRFGCHTQMMLYMSLLLQKASGKGPLHKSAFMTGKAQWLNDVYHKILPGCRTDFSKWLANVREKAGQALNQAKSQTSSKIRRALAAEPDAIPYCLIITTPDDKGKSLYDINLTPDEICIPDELQELLG